MTEFEGLPELPHNLPLSLQGKFPGGNLLANQLSKTEAALS